MTIWWVPPLWHSVTPHFEKSWPCPWSVLLKLCLTYSYDVMDIKHDMYVLFMTLILLTLLITIKWHSVAVNETFVWPQESIASYNPNILPLFILSCFCWFAFRHSHSSEFFILTCFVFHFWISILWQEINQQSLLLLWVESILLVMVLVLLVRTQIVHASRYELRSIHV